MCRQNDKMIIYISGPITGMKNGNARAFKHMERVLRYSFSHILNLKIINPVDLGERVDAYFTDVSKILREKIKPVWEDYMRVCIAELVNCTHIIFLPGHEKSRGCETELYIAERLGLAIFYTVEEMRRQCAV